MTAFTMTIDGEQRRGAHTFAVTNPATEDVFAQAPAGSPEQLEEAVAGAERAFAAWRRDEAVRCKALRVASERLRAEADAIARTLTLEQGKPLRQAVGEVVVASGRWGLESFLQRYVVNQRFG